MILRPSFCGDCLFFSASKVVLIFKRKSDMSKSAWGELAGRLRGAWSILRHGAHSLSGQDALPDEGGACVANKHLDRAARKMAADASKSWAKRAKDWHLQHSRVYRAASVAQGFLLAQEALQGSAFWREELRAVDESEYWSARFSDNLFSIAIASLDDSSEEQASESCRLHAAWKEADGRPLSPREIEQAAGAVQRSCWWEVAEAWYAQLSVIAKKQASSGATPVSHENAYEWVRAAAWCFESITLRLEREGGPIMARERAAWNAYCGLPWPKIALSKEIQDWLARKMGSVIMPMSSEEQEEVFAGLDLDSTWRNVLEAIVKTSPERRGVQPNNCDELWAMLESAALEQDVDESKLPSRSQALRI